MDSYSTLIQKILNVPLLADHVQTLAADYEALNLVTMDWKERLANHTPFQEFQHDTRRMFRPEYNTWNNFFRIQNLRENVRPLKLIVAGYGKMVKPYEKNTRMAVFMNDSPVMEVLLKALTNDIDLTLIKLDDNCRLNFKTCSMCCQYCSSSRDTMITYNIPVKFEIPQPCIADTLLYDGKTIINRFGSQIVQNFSGDFITIIKMELNVRYFYTTKETGEQHVRVGGIVYKMLCFPESNLKLAKVELGDLNSLTHTETILDEPIYPQEMEGFGEKKRSVEDEEVDDDDVIDIFPREKKQKTWADDFEVTEENITLK